MMAWLGAASAWAQAGKVLVFTGTAGTQNAASANALSALQAAGTAGGYTVDTTADAAQITAANLATYRAVVFVNSAGDVLNAAQETDLASYVNGGGGFVGVGETAKLEEGNAAFDTLLGLTGTPRTTAASATSIQDVEFLDRVHPATRDLSALRAQPQRQLLPVDQQPDGPGPHRRARALQHHPDGRRHGPHLRHQRRRPASDRQRQHAAAAAPAPAVVVP